MKTRWERWWHCFILTLCPVVPLWSWSHENKDRPKFCRVLGLCILMYWYRRSRLGNLLKVEVIPLIVLGCQGRRMVRRSWMMSSWRAWRLTWRATWSRASPWRPTCILTSWSSEHSWLTRVSNGRWVDWLEKLGIALLVELNCGFLLRINTRSFWGWVFWGSNSKKYSRTAHQHEFYLDFLVIFI